MIFRASRSQAAKETKSVYLLGFFLCFEGQVHFFFFKEVLGLFYFLQETRVLWREIIHEENPSSHFPKAVAAADHDDVPGKSQKGLLNWF